MQWFYKILVLMTLPMMINSAAEWLCQKRVMNWVTHHISLIASSAIVEMVLCTDCTARFSPNSIHCIVLYWPFAAFIAVFILSASICVVSFSKWPIIHFPMPSHASLTITIDCLMPIEICVVMTIDPSSKVTSICWVQPAQYSEKPVMFPISRVLTKWWLN